MDTGDDQKVKEFVKCQFMSGIGQVFETQLIMVLLMTICITILSIILWRNTKRVVIKYHSLSQTCFNSNNNSVGRHRHPAAPRLSDRAIDFRSVHAQGEPQGHTSIQIDGDERPAVADANGWFKPRV